MDFCSLSVFVFEEIWAAVYFTIQLFYAGDLAKLGIVKLTAPGKHFKYLLCVLFLCRIARESVHFRPWHMKGQLVTYLNLPTAYHTVLLTQIFSINTFYCHLARAIHSTLWAQPNIYIYITVTYIHPSWVRIKKRAHDMWHTTIIILYFSSFQTN